MILNSKSQSKFSQIRVLVARGSRGFDGGVAKARIDAPKLTDSLLWVNLIKQRD